jgi:hypothetical protein
MDILMKCLYTTPKPFSPEQVRGILEMKPIRSSKVEQKRELNSTNSFLLIFFNYLGMRLSCCLKRRQHIIKEGDELVIIG